MQISIPARYCGPSTSGNGGWTAGLLAAAAREHGALTGPMTVRLSAPPPLDRELDVQLTTTGSTLATLADDAATVATASAAKPWSLDPVPFVEPGAAAATASDYVSPDRHPFPHCFVCGPAREPGDGMRLTPGHLPAGGTACLWRPADTLHGDPVTEADVWAALDCPGGWASDIVGRPMVLGTMTAQVERLPEPEATYVVTGRLDRADGRRSWTSSALWDSDGGLLARAEAVWVEIDAAAFNAILAG